MIGEPTATGQRGATFEARLDADEPFLDDHRPGGQPLLGTAMSLELMIRALDRTGVLRHGPLRIDDVAVGAPFVLQDRAAIISLTATPSVTRPGARSCATTSLDGDRTVVHVSADLAASPMPPDRRLGVGRDRRVHPPAATAADIYGLFFHGPAYQVLERATLSPDGLVAVLAPPRPIERAGSATVSAVYAVEACLQTAGLLEIATNARMMIPHAIVSVVWSGDTAPPPPLTAIATRRPDGTIDVDLADAAGTLQLTLRSYRTVPLPFPVAREPIERLHEALRQAIS